MLVMTTMLGTLIVLASPSPVVVLPVLFPIVALILVSIPVTTPVLIMILVPATTQVPVSVSIPIPVKIRIPSGPPPSGAVC